MTTNDKPVCYQARVMHKNGIFAAWQNYDTTDLRDRFREHWTRLGCKVETRDVYARPQPSDDPELDGIEGCNPAWFRGVGHGVSVLSKKVLDILDGKDDGRGVASEPWEATRRRLLAISQPAAPQVPEAMTAPVRREVKSFDEAYGNGVADGWNACRAKMLATPPAPDQSKQPRPADAKWDGSRLTFPPKPAGDVEADALAHVYAAGRLNGHLNTVEGTYVDAMYCDYAELFSETAREVYDDARKYLAAQPAQGEGEK